MNNSRLLKAKSIIQRAWTQDYLVSDHNDEGQKKHCALGAIGKTFEDEGVLELDNDMWYGDIPVEDVVVLAYEISPEAVDSLIEALNEGLDDPLNIYSVVYNYNDEHGKEDVADVFNSACKNYKEHEDKIVEFWKACYMYNGIKDNNRPITFAHEQELADVVGVELQ